MNKTKLIDRVAEKSGLTKKDCSQTVNALLAEIAAAMQREDKVQLIGFGSFSVKKRSARTGKNPRTKEPVEIPACALPVFKAGKELKDLINR